MQSLCDNSKCMKDYCWKYLIAFNQINYSHQSFERCEMSNPSPQAQQDRTRQVKIEAEPPQQLLFSVPEVAYPWPLLPLKLEEHQCKIEDYPAYTIHSFQHEKDLRCINPSEALEVAFQKRAIWLANRKEVTIDERTEMLYYRHFRLNQYLLKKGRRDFSKKIVYSTRKRVADRRIRYKGKFINEDQARLILGLPKDSHSFDQLKEKMNSLKSLPQISSLSLS